MSTVYYVAVVAIIAFTPLTSKHGLWQGTLNLFTAAADLQAVTRASAGTD